MPINTTTHTFSDGRPYVRAFNSGYVSADEARGIATRLSPGGDLAGVPMLNVMEAKVDISSEARKIFAGVSKGAGLGSKMAMVTASAPLRVTLSFVLRIAGQAADTKFFATEAEALQWLESASATR